MALTDWLRFRRNISLYVAWLVVIIALLTVIFPLFWLVRTSFMDVFDTHHDPPYWLPPKLVLDNFRAGVIRGSSAVGIDVALEGMKHSLIIAIANAFICVFIGFLGAYTIVRFRTGGPHLSFWILSNRFLPPIAFIVPLFVIFRTLGIYGTHLSLVLVYMTANIPFATWILMGFLEEIPKELDEAAMIDGASRLDVIFRVILPVIAPGVVVVLLFLFIACWNEYLMAFILSGSDWDTLAVTIPKFRFGPTLAYPQIAAASLIGVIPGLVFAILIHRYLARGLTFGAIK